MNIADKKQIIILKWFFTKKKLVRFYRKKEYLKNAKNS